MFINIKKNRGFSLLELIIVVVILAIMSSIALPGYLSFKAEAKVSQVAEEIKNMMIKSKVYSMRGGFSEIKYDETSIRMFVKKDGYLDEYTEHFSGDDIPVDRNDNIVITYSRTSILPQECIDGLCNLNIYYIVSYGSDNKYRRKKVTMNRSGQVKVGWIE